MYTPRTLASLTLTALILAARPASAQTLSLQSGDNVVVTASGTHGTYQGQSIGNSTSAYSLDAASGTVVSVPTGSVFALQGGSLSVAPSSGSMAVGLSVTGGRATVSGGTIRGGDYYGTALYASGGGTIVVTGGAFSAGYADLVAVGGTIDLFGTFAPIAPMTGNFSSGTITGTLQNGQAITAYYQVQNGGVIEFNVAPEPSAFVALSLGILGLGRLMLKARSRKVSLT